MSTRTQLTLFALVTLPLALLATVALTTPLPGPPTTPTTTVSSSPSVGVWYVACPSAHWRHGPYTSPDTCRVHLEWIRDHVCTRPLHLDGSVNEEFVAVATVCRDAYNATHCACEFTVAVARPQTVGDFLSGR